jgi:hypothetical protein
MTSLRSSCSLVQKGTGVAEEEEGERPRGERAELVREDEEETAKDKAEEALGGGRRLTSLQGAV